MVVNEVKPTPPAWIFNKDRVNKIQGTPSGAEDEIPITLGEYPTKPFEPELDKNGKPVLDKNGKPVDKNAYWNKTYGGEDKKGYVKSEGTVYSFASGMVGSLHLSQEVDKNTGKIKKTSPGSTTDVSNLLIKYYPYNSKGMIPHRSEDGESNKFYLEKGGKVRKGYQLRATGETKSGKKFLINDETKGLLKTKFPNNVHDIKTSNGDAVNIDDIPLTIDQGEQDPDYKEETPKETKTTKPKKDPLKLF
jgi:hypothetical protein